MIEMRTFGILKGHFTKSLNKMRWNVLIVTLYLYFLLLTHYFLLVTIYFLPVTRYVLFVTRYFLLDTFYSLFFFKGGCRNFHKINLYKASACNVLHWLWKFLITELWNVHFSTLKPIIMLFFIKISLDYNSSD